MNVHATRKRNIFDPVNSEPFALSRSKIELFFQCKRCFYLDRRLGVAPPRGFPFNLNDAVDVLLKKEFDIYREKQEPHPFVVSAGLSLVPMQHTDLAVWRDPFKGVRYHHESSNFIVFGGVDDVWHDAEGVVTVVDYKATSKNGEVTIDAAWQRSYKRQLEVYQWLFRHNGFAVSDTGYFVYANGDRSAGRFDDMHCALQRNSFRIPDLLIGWMARLCRYGSCFPSDDDTVCREDGVIFVRTARRRGSRFVHICSVIPDSECLVFRGLLMF